MDENELALAHLQERETPMKRIQRILALVLSISLANVSMVQTANAALVSTEQVAALGSTEATGSGHARLTAALSRADVQAAMEQQGVDPAQAMERVASLTDEEAGRLAAQIDNAPAGGIIGALLLVFFVLLVTDILGLTKVFPFTRSVR
jgi:hypothetical protein